MTPEELKAKCEATVTDFAQAMRREMWANAVEVKDGHLVEFKGDWAGTDQDVALRDLLYHAAKLAFAMRAGQKAETLEYAADVANMAMIVADVSGVLTAEFLAAPGNVSRYDDQANKAAA